MLNQYQPVLLPPMVVGVLLLVQLLPQLLPQLRHLPLLLGPLIQPHLLLLPSGIRLLPLKRAGKSIMLSHQEISKVENYYETT